MIYYAFHNIFLKHSSQKKCFQTNEPPSSSIHPWFDEVAPFIWLIFPFSHLLFIMLIWWGSATEERGPMESDNETWPDQPKDKDKDKDKSQR